MIPTTSTELLWLSLTYALLAFLLLCLCLATRWQWWVKAIMVIVVSGFFLLHNQVLHEQVVLLTVVVEDTPRVALDRRFEVDAYGDGFFRVLLHYGFTEEPDVPQALSLCHLDELDFSPMRTTYFLSRETVIPTRRIGMARWREALFAFMLKNANGNLRFFNLPLNRVIELGTQVEM